MNGFESLLEKAVKENEEIVLRDHDKPQVVSSGIWVFDYVSSCGGFPKKRIIELHGKESSGKTTVALSGAAEAQKQGMYILFLDFEQAFDPVYAQSLGMDLHPSKAAVLQPITLEQGSQWALEFFKTAALENMSIFCVIDSLPAMLPGKMRDNVEEVHKFPGLQARMTGAFLADLTVHARITKSVVVVLNQMRANLTMGPVFGGEKEKATGGYAVKHYISQSYKLKVVKRENIKDNPAPDGSNAQREGSIHVKVWNAKNKVGKAHRSGIMYVTVGVGIDNLRYAVESAVAKGVLKKAGSWIRFRDDETLKYQGMPKLLSALTEDATLIQFLLSCLGWLTSDGTIDLFSEDNGDGYEEENIEEVGED